MLKRISEAVVMVLLCIIGLLPLLADSSDGTMQSPYWRMKFEVTSPEQGSEVGNEFEIQGDLTAVEVNGEEASSSLEDVWLSVYWRLVDNEKTLSPAVAMPYQSDDVVCGVLALSSDAQQNYCSYKLTLFDDHAEGDTITAKWKIIVDTNMLNMAENPPGTKLKLSIEPDRSADIGIKEFEVNSVVDGPYALTLIYRPVEQ